MLSKLASFSGVKGPVVTIVMDGFGIAKSDVGSAIAAANTPTLDKLYATCPHITLRAHGTAVGMPSDDDMGNSEVGHNAIGAGQVYSQGAALVADAIANGSIWQGQAWQEIVAGAKASTLHFIGLFSDGNVHAHVDHLKAMILRAKEEITRGDRLVPATQTSLPSYVPHKPDSDIQGRIIAVYGGLAEAGRLSVVTLNKGTRDGLEVGHVVALYRNRIADTRDENERRQLVNLPAERYGLAFVFRTFEKVAYALVMESNGSVYVNDAVRNP